MSSLNDEQRDAVCATDGAVLVIAGAGTGKTKVLTSRIAHIVSSGLCSIDEILAVTFTNKAAKEMMDRAINLLKEIDSNIKHKLWIGTFHSLALKMIRMVHDNFGRTSHFTIVDAEDQVKIIKRIERELGIEDSKYPPKLMMYYINRWKDQYQTADAVRGSVRKFSNEEVASVIYARYQSVLQSMDAIDFGDILMICLDVFKYNGDPLKEYRDKFKYIMVDEYQDTNFTQCLWIKMLSQKTGNICCVGDDDQAIYGWRGADVGNILKFERHFIDAKIIRLGKNYRSTSNILRAASTLIANNSMRMQKDFWTDEEAGLPVIVKVLQNPFEEARFVAALIMNKYTNGTKLGSMAILVRVSFQIRLFEEALLAAGVPYAIIGGVKFYERREVKDAIAYLKLVVNHDDGISFERIVNTPRRGIGAAAIAKFHDIARQQSISLPKAAQLTSKKLELFFMQLDTWREMANTKSVRDLMRYILKDSGYIEMLKEQDNLENEARVESLEELLSSLGDDLSLYEFLDYVGLLSDNLNETNQDRVLISTIHAAKGLEFQTIFIPGFEENIIPHQRSIMENGELGLEEERRLCYVAITRARKEVYITLCSMRSVYGQSGGWHYSTPSRFLHNLPKGCVKIL